MKADKITFDPKGVKLLSGYAAPGTLYAMCLDEPNRTLYGAGSDGGIHAVVLPGETPTHPSSGHPSGIGHGIHAIEMAFEKPGAILKWASVHENYISSLALVGGNLVSTGYDGRIIWTDPANGKRIRSVTAHAGWVRKLAVTTDGKRLVTVGDDMLVKVHDAATGKAQMSLAGHDARVPEGYLSALYTVAVSADGRYAASGDRAGFIRVWDLTTGKKASEFRAAEFYTFDSVKRARAIGGVRGLAFSVDGSRLAISGIGPVTNVDGFVGPCRIDLWDWKSAKRSSFAQERHQAILNHVVFGPADGWLMAAGGGDGGGALVFWKPGGAAAHIAKPKGHLHAFAVDAAGTRLYAAGHAGFQVWQLRA